MAETPCGSVHESPVRGQRTRQTLKVGRYRLHAPGSAIVLGRATCCTFPRVYLPRELHYQIPTPLATSEPAPPPKDFNGENTTYYLRPAEDGC